MVIDPVCGVELEQHEAVGVSEYRDKVYYFCSGICKEEFDQRPAKYAKRPAAPVEAADNARL